MIKTIHHFEDEPELLHWIPSALLNRYWAEHPEWVVNQGEFREEERLTTFNLSLDSIPFTINYRVYRNKPEFDERFSTFAKNGDVVLLDVMIEDSEERSLKPVGLELRKIAAQVVGDDRVFLLTAFPHHTRDQFNVPEEAVIPKPPDVDSLLDLLIEKLSIESQP